MPLFMIRNDLSKVQADALVNPANTDLLEGSGTSRAIYLAAGEDKLTRACREIGHCDLGKAVITPAFDLNAQYVIHAVGPVWVDGKHGEEELLHSAYTTSLNLAKEYQLESIAFPILSAGNYGFPKDRAVKIAIHAISDFLMEYELQVYLVFYDRETVAVSKKLFASLEEYIDDHYVDDHNELFDSMPRNIRYRAYGSEFTQAEASFPMESAVFAPKQSLEDLMGNMDETFSKMLLRLIDERGLKDSYVYKKANIDRRHFSKIRNNESYVPNKRTVLAFAIALELTLDETKDLLKRAGFAFSNSSKFDVIICFFIENGQYNIFEINEMLFAYDQPLLGE